jgi:hypothetical protein
VIVCSVHERVDHLTEASDLDQWQMRDPMPEDILANRIVRPPE